MRSFGVMTWKWVDEQEDHGVREVLVLLRGDMDHSLSAICLDPGATGGVVAKDIWEENPASGR